ncbi:MAG: NADH:flavin oxidoreductase/NADH oxidase [Opitutaceae bacterium]|jgi:2,4-dienoyl-CoA reductase-like NADH-dependent reductase (Old Yellow Enzyme family)|nr:NADH:flavin oxidoreductase/NADH oxidase [Opitutaceae bacterium]
MSTLFSPFQLKSVTLRNRIGISPMCQYQAGEGVAGDWHLVHYGARAAGGAGLIIVEAAAVAANGRITPHDLGLWADWQIEPLAQINRFIKAQGAVPGLQINHAGRKASCARPWEGGAHLADDAGGWPLIAPSALPFGGALSKVPAEMTGQQICETQMAFAAAAGRARQAGVEWLEIHAAHGYLAHSFYSPLSNRRTDGYGGSFDNRVRFLLETVKTVRQVWPEQLPLTARISATDWADGGWTLEDSVELARRLKAAGVDLIDASAGGAVPGAAIPAPKPGFQVPFGERIRAEAGIATATVGLIADPMLAETIVSKGRADIVLIGRESLRDPHWPLHAAQTLGVRQSFGPPQYARAW